MNPEIKDRWTTALRSGDFTQGKGSLTFVYENGTQKDCCLGVLCKLAVTAGVIPPGELVPMVNTTRSPVAYGDQRAEGLLPVEVVEWAGLSSDNPMVEKMGCYCPLTSLNDTGTSFAEIADLIDNSL
jgi:hypothetical protein